MVAIGAAALLPTLLATRVGATTALRLMAVVVVGAVGLPFLASVAAGAGSGTHDAASRWARRAACLAAGWAAWAMVSTLVSRNPDLAFVGSFTSYTGGLFVLALAGAWALGVSLDLQGRAWLERTLLATALANAFVAIGQTVVDLGPVGLGAGLGRGSGFFANPAFAGGYVAAGLWLIAHRMATNPVRWSVAAALTAGGVQALGGRLPLGLLVAAVMAAVPAFGWRRATRLALCAAVGIGAATAAASLAGLPSGGATGTARLEEAALSGVRPRIEAWRGAALATADRPLFGAGPGRFGEATGPYRTLAMARAEGPDRYFLDAHNLVAEYAATTGVPGVVLLVGFLVAALAAAGYRSPLAGFAILGLADHLLQPQHLSRTTLVVLALGAAAAGRERKPAGRPVVRAAVPAVAVVAAAVLVSGAVSLRTGRLERDPQAARLAARLTPWPEPLDEQADIVSEVGGSSPGVVDLRRRAVDREPGLARWWNNLGDEAFRSGDAAMAERAWRAALGRDPWSLRAVNGLARILIDSGRTPEAKRLLRRSLLIDATQSGVMGELASLGS